MILGPTCQLLVPSKVGKGAGIGRGKRIGFPIIAPFFISELRSLNRSKMAGTEDRSAHERPLLTTMKIRCGKGGYVTFALSPKCGKWREGIQNSSY